MNRVKVVLWVGYAGLSTLVAYAIGVFCVVRKRMKEIRYGH